MSASRFATVLGTLVAAVVYLNGCVRLTPQRAWRGEPIDVPEEALVYSSDAKADDEIGGTGAPELEAEVKAALAERGDQAVADGALMATASWVLNEVNQGRAVGPMGADAASRHFGFAGVIFSAAAFESQNAKTVRDALGQVPKNVPVNRFGVCKSPQGRSSAVVFGNVEVSIEPISRFLEPPATVNLKGEVASRFAFAHVYLTKQDGTVEEQRMPSRKLEYSKTFSTPGRYKLEVMGDGPTGPVVISNLPLFVGVAERSLRETVRKRPSPAEAEARMLELLNATRVAAGLHQVQPDSELRDVALGHSNDMADHNFFSHVSPSTGTPADRLRRSGVLVAEAAENIAQADTPENAHDGLMESPGHRSAMLGARYTHVGIAVVGSDRGLIVTMVFGRRADPSKLPRDASQLEAALLALRAVKGLSRPSVDPIYRAAAQRGAQAYVKATNPAPDIAAKATSAAIRSEVNRLRTSRPGACTLFMELLEADQLEQVEMVFDPGLVKFGIGAQLRTDDKGSRLATMLVFEGVRCR
jgi:uncharacterized protein YkwD